jgi:hypothetical protein
MLSAIKEDEVVTGHHVLSHGMRDDGMKPIEMLPHVGGLRVNKDSNRGR